MKVSIITTTYNAEKYLKETLNSVMNQTFKDFEYILIDDCSKDGSISIIKSYTDERIKFTKNEKNLGIVGSRNKALEMAKGEYICFLDHDDVWKSSEKLEKEVNILENNKNIGLVGSFVEFINENSQIIGEFKYEVNDENIRKKILTYNQFCTCSVIFRKSFIEKVGLLDEKYNKVDDYDLWLKIGKISEFYNIPENLVQYRKMSTNTSRSNINFLKMKVMHLKLIIKNFKYYPNGIKAMIFSLINIIIPYRLAEILRPIYKKIIG